MSLDYQKVWNALNELESITSKICSARQILESALDALENHKYNKAETLMYAVDEYLQYYLEEFDRKFKDAWNETVMKVKEQQYNNAWESHYYPEKHNMPPWGHSNMEALSKQKEDKVVKWRLPVQETEDSDTGEKEYFIQFPDDLLERTGWKENDNLNWVDNGDGTFTLTKVTEYPEVIKF